MAHTAKNMEDRARAAAMSRRRSGAKRDADAVEPLSLDEARRMRGSGWEGDLDEMRAAREVLA
ncbi:MAG: type II toxin-antitoxin system VapB family antitoxin [Alphaproteobacteria bacterium]|nr:type II toxin-antitoxin system VapB family antitoxin [Alphaproteobacteria bacterium]